MNLRNLIIVAMSCGTLVQCKPAREPESVIKASSTAGGLELNCRNLLTEPEEIRILEYASELASESFTGKISTESRDKKLDDRVTGTPKGDKRNAVRFAIAKAMELSASAWVLPRAIAYISKKTLSDAEYKALDAMGVEKQYADAYMDDVGNHFAKPYKSLTDKGFELSINKGWSLAGDDQPGIDLASIKKDSKFISAFILFFGTDLTEKLLDSERTEVLYADNIALTPPNKSGKVTTYKKTEWEQRVKERLKSIEREADTFVRASKEANTYSNRMQGRILEWFGVERGVNGQTAPEIAMESSYKALLSNINTLRDQFGVGRDMSAKLLALMQTLNNIDLKNIEVGIQKLNNATYAAIAAPFIPVIIWAAPYAGALAMGEAWAPIIAASSAKMALLPMAFAAGTSAISAGIRSSTLGGNFFCNFYEQFTDRGASALVTAPFMAAVPVVLASGAGGATLASGSICAQTTYGVLNLGLSVGAIGMMSKSGIQGLSACYSQVQSAHKSGEEGNMLGSTQRN